MPDARALAQRMQRQLRAAPLGASGRVLVLVAHPAIHRSRVNRALADALLDLDGVTLHDLYDAYPDMDIDVSREKALVEAHDALVWQHPFYWYSTPALLKEWQDLVLEFGWAYGTGGVALRGKPFLQALSTGGPDAAYAEDNAERFSLRQLLAPIEATARLCGLDRRPTFAVHGAHVLSEAAIEAEARRYRATIVALRDSLPARRS